MMTSIEESPLYSIANPKSLAFFGASNNLTAMGTNLLLSVQALGFEGPIYPVHPKSDTVLGLKAFQSIDDVPIIPDLAVIVLPTAIVNNTLEACGKRGLRNAIVVSGGFKEGGEEGRLRELELTDIIQRYGICLLGPNCLGVTNPHQRLNTTFIPYEGPPGFIGLASQSGSLITQLFEHLFMMGWGFSTAFSVGNEAVVDVVDCMEYLAVCPHTRVIGLYIEGIRRGARFIETARRIVPHKPIVALYVGGSEAGRRAGFSHTGAMAGSDRLYEGLFRQSGIIRARSVTELFDFCGVLGSQPLPRGARVLIQTHSGGPGAAAADACGRAGLEVPLLSPEALEALAPFVPNTGSVQNPVDLTFTKNPLDFYSKIPQVLAGDRNTDTLLVYFMTPSQVVARGMRWMGVPEDQIAKEGAKMMDDQCRSFMEAVQPSGKPLVGFTFRGHHEPSIQGLTRRGVPVFPGPERAARSVAAMVQYAEFRKKWTAPQACKDA